MPNVETVVYRDGWPQDPKALDDADAIVLFSDGGDGNPMLPHLDQIDKLMKHGVGLACIHYAVEVPKGKPGDLLKDWIGGYFETFWSVNPFWTAEFKQFPDHPDRAGRQTVCDRGRVVLPHAVRATTWRASRRS